ncbi:MAG: phosphoribosylglycinamide formyltransferase [Methyloceanibacter sp.]|nr:MAG: phosphoribosylglycinamide formyltransferase [Methyloceanibacter sp.]
MSAKKRVGVLISGRGTNLQALIDAAKAPEYPAELGLVISNVPGVQGLARAEAAGISTRAIKHQDFPSRERFEDALDEALNQAGVELLCNAGFMRLLTESFVSRWLNRHLNIHPSLLPAFKGLDTHGRVLRSGAQITGCTVHFVRAAMDDGPIVAQAAVPVLPGDTEEVLAGRCSPPSTGSTPMPCGWLPRAKWRWMGNAYRERPPGWAVPLFFRPRFRQFLIERRKSRENEPAGP